MTDRERWDALAIEKSSRRAAWDEELTDGIAECLAELLPYMPASGIVYDLGCGPGRLAVPLAESIPDIDIWGLDVSLNMISDAMVHPRVHYLILRDTDVGYCLPYHSDATAAYSVLTFQHVDEGAVRGYLNQLGRLLPEGATFRFQYVEEGGDRFVASVNQMSQWCADSGMAVAEIDYGRVFPTWTWITAVAH